MRYHVSAVYADDLGDEPQAYETTVEANSREDAEHAAQEVCRQDNGRGDAQPGDSWYEPLADVFARPVLDDIRAGLDGLSRDELQALAAEVARRLDPVRSGRI